MPKLATESSKPRLSEVARHVVVPAGVVTTAWPRVVAKCAEMGVTFDPWQHGIGQIALGKRKDGKYAATVGGVVLSIPRQVGKTFLVGMIVIALCVLFPGYTALWTAHRTRTATKTFASMQGMVRKKKIWPHVDAVRTSNGEQEIRFKNGSIIMFGAREQGFGRGFDQVDSEIFDEAQILSEKALEDMVPAANQSQHEAGALLFFMGTPPRPSDPGDEFSNRRSKALAGKGENTAYIEFSADRNADLEDKAQWAKANPSFPHRTPLESMERMREQLTDDDSFRREALGIWDEETSETSVISADAWALQSIADVPEEWPLAAIGVDMNPERTKITLTMAAFSEAGVHLEIPDSAPDADSPSEKLVDWIYARARRRVPVVIDAYSPARSLEPLLKKRGCKVFILGPAELSQACGGLVDAVIRDATLTHFNQEPLNDSLAGTFKEPFGKGGAFKWNRKTFDVDLTPIMAATCAHYGAVKFGKRRKPGSKAGGKVMIL